MSRATTPTSNPRIYGDPPYTVALLHGGPGAAGYMESVARNLSRHRGVLELLQTRMNVDELVEETRELMGRGGRLPLILVGHSWGAWLALLFAAKYPHYVRKLVLISSGVFDRKYLPDIHERRRARMNEEERAFYDGFIEGRIQGDRDRALARLGLLTTLTDSFDPYPTTQDHPTMRFNHAQYEAVWREADAMRSDGRLLEAAARVHCPVVAVHGDHDPGPPEGVQEPLERVLKDFEFHLLKDCGHDPWHERRAREEFYRIMDEQLGP